MTNHATTWAMVADLRRSPSDGAPTGNLMKSSEARAEVVKALEGTFGPAGFAYRKAEEAFTRAFEGGRDVVSFGFWSYPPSHVFSLVPAVRIDAIERLYHAICDTPERDRRGTVSLPVQIWKLAGMEKPLRDVPLPGFGSPFYYTVSSVTEIATAIRPVEQVTRDLILPFLASHHDIGTVNRAINHEGLDTSAGRILHGLIAAHLANDAAYGAIQSKYRKEMQSWSANNREQFERAVAYLAAHSA